VLGFFSGRPNWDSPTPSTQASVSPLPLVPVEGGKLACVRGGGGSQFGRGDRHVVLFIYTYFVVRSYVEKKPEINFALSSTVLFNFTCPICSHTPLVCLKIAEAKLYWQQYSMRLPFLRYLLGCNTMSEFYLL
jgi:hypothetical protein